MNLFCTLEPERCLLYSSKVHTLRDLSELQAFPAQPSDEWNGALLVQSIWRYNGYTVMGGA